MRGLVLRFLMSALSLGLTTQIVRGVHADGISALLLAAFILGILNAIIRPVILLLTLPINLLTLGLFTFVINAGMLAATAALVPAFHIDGFWPAFFGAVVLAIVSALLNWLIRDVRERRRVD